MVKNAKEKTQGGAKDALEKLDEFLSSQTEALDVNPHDLQSAFISQAPSFFKAASRHNKAERVVAQQKDRLEALLAEKDGEIRNSGEKHTENSIAAAKARDKDVLKVKDILNAARYQADQYRSLVRSWEHRRDMLIQMGSTYRAELQANISINRGEDEEVPEARSPRASAFKPGFD